MKLQLEKSKRVSELGVQGGVESGKDKEEALICSRHQKELTHEGLCVGLVYTWMDT